MISQLEETRDNIRQGHHADQLFREKIVENHWSVQSETIKTEDMSRLLQNEIGNHSKL